MKLSKDFIKKNSDLLNRLNLLEDEKVRSRFINHLEIDAKNSKVVLSCKYDNGSKVHLTPNTIYRFEQDGFNINLKKLEKELIDYTKNFIIREADEKIGKVRIKLNNNGVELD